MPRIRRTVASLVAPLLFASAPARAQSAGDGFLFRPPSGVFTLRGGFDHANAGSDLFSFTTRQLTVGPGDFSGFTFGADFTYRAAPRLDIVLFGVSVSRSVIPSEFRDFVDNERKPIQQSTEFIRVPVTAAAKIYLSNPGRAVGHFAWIPARWAPYAGAGAGAMWYRFNQQGDFIDFATTRVFTDEFDSSGWTPAVVAFAGAEISLGPRVALAAEGRYHYARAMLGPDFARFERLDLSGVAVTTGLSIRY